MTSSLPQLSRHHPLQPPSHRDPKYRKAQMLRSYVSLLQSTPLMLIFQHNSIKTLEWTLIRRELSRALSKTDTQNPHLDPIAPLIRLQVIQTTMFEPALRITEHFDPTQPPSHIPETLARPRDEPTLTHALSSRAYHAATAHQGTHALAPLLQGAIAILTFPTVSPIHVASALSILAPHKPAFPAPTRRSTPSYYEPPVQEGLKKLMLLGARVEGRAFDHEDVRWMGGIEGGIDGLRAQVVQLLQSAGVGLMGALEGAGRNLWVAMEGRRRDLEDKEGGGGKGKEK